MLYVRDVIDGESASMFQMQACNRNKALLIAWHAGHAVIFVTMADWQSVIADLAIGLGCRRHSLSVLRSSGGQRNIVYRVWSPIGFCKNQAALVRLARYQ